MKKNFWTSIALILSAIILFLLAWRARYEYLIAFSGIFFGVFGPFITKNIEMEKQKQKLYLDKKHEEYQELYNLISECPFKIKKLVLELDKQEDERSKKETLKTLSEYCMDFIQRVLSQNIYHSKKLNLLLSDFQIILVPLVAKIYAYGHVVLDKSGVKGSIDLGYGMKELKNILDLFKEKQVIPLNSEEDVAQLSLSPEIETLVSIQIKIAKLMKQELGEEG